MSNLLPIRHKKISKTGYGWKIFKKMDSGRYNSLFGGKRYIRDDKSGFVTWREGRGGFFFFLNKKDAERLLEQRNKPTAFDKLIPENKNIVEVIKKISYEEGMGSFDLVTMSFWREEPYHVALCKKFKIMKG